MSKGSKRYTASSTDPKVVQPVIDKLEGLLQNIRDRRPKYNADGSVDTPDTRPQATAVVLVAQQLGCSTRTVQRWLQLHEGRRNDYTLSEAFCDVYECISTELAECVSSKMFAIAKNVAHPQAFAAQKYLLPKIDPYAFGEKTVSTQEARQLADYPSEMFDEMSAEDKARLQEISDQQDALDNELDCILKKTQQKITDQIDDT